MFQFSGKTEVVQWNLSKPRFPCLTLQGGTNILMIRFRASFPWCMEHNKYPVTFWND